MFSKSLESIEIDTFSTYGAYFNVGILLMAGPICNLFNRFTNYHNAYNLQVKPFGLREILAHVY